MLIRVPILVLNLEYILHLLAILVLRTSRSSLLPLLHTFLLTVHVLQSILPHVQLFSAPSLLVLVLLPYLLVLGIFIVRVVEGNHYLDVGELL